MKVDFRKKQQSFKNVNGLSDVYVWKEENNFYGVGINGTSHHHKVHIDNVSAKINLLINLNN